MASSGFHANTLSETPYYLPVQPADSFVNRDPFNDYTAFTVNAIEPRVQTTAMKFGQKHIHDNPMGQKYIGSLQNDRIMPPTFTVPSFTPAIEPVDSVEATEAPAEPVAVAKPAQAGSGRMNVTEHIAPHDFPRPYGQAHLKF